MKTANTETIAKAEKILNRTLVYQAAVAVHEIKEALGLEVGELRLVVAPEVIDFPGCYRVTCTIAAAAVAVEAIVQPGQLIAPVGNRTMASRAPRRAKRER